MKPIFSIGQRVAYSGYLATVIEICTGRLSGMYVILLERGRSCVCGSQLACMNGAVVSEVAGGAL